MPEIKFATKPPQGDRMHYVTEEDVLVVLNRLPGTLWVRLKQVHFNDRAWGNRTLGYVTKNRHEIAICALPANVSLGRCCAKYGGTPLEFGAPSRGQWPQLAVRRFLLYDVLLHEIGHLQMVNPAAKSVRRQFAGEKYAEAFAVQWRRTLWKERFDHPDPVHNPPAAE